MNVIELVAKTLNPHNPFSLLKSLRYTAKYTSKCGKISCGKKVHIYTSKAAITIFKGNSVFALRPCSVGYTGHPLFDNTFIQNKGELLSQGGLQLKPGVRIAVGENAHLHLGYNVLIEYNTKIMASDSITIGDHTWISWDCNIMDTDFHTIIDNDVELPKTKPIRIGNNCWIAKGVTILKGVTIGDNVIIGANSVVSRDIPSNCLAVGTPCRVLKENINWKK